MKKSFPGESRLLFFLLGIYLVTVFKSNTPSVLLNERILFSSRFVTPKKFSSCHFDACSAAERSNIHFATQTFRQKICMLGQGLQWGSRPILGMSTVQASLKLMSPSASNVEAAVITLLTRSTKCLSVRTLPEVFFTMEFRKMISRGIKATPFLKTLERVLRLSSLHSSIDAASSCRVKKV